jgi:hypothetical protein
VGRLVRRISAGIGRCRPSFGFAMSAITIHPCGKSCSRDSNGTRLTSHIEMMTANTREPPCGHARGECGGWMVRCSPMAGHGKGVIVGILLVNRVNLEL